MPFPIIFKHDYCYIQQISGERLQDDWSSGFIISHDAPRGVACMDPRSAVGRIYKEDHYIYTLLHIKKESSVPCGFGEEDFFYIFCHCKSTQSKYQSKAKIH